VAPPAGEAEAGYAAAARALSAVPPVVGTEAPPAPSNLPELDGKALLRAGLEGVLPGGSGGFALPLALAALRPDVMRWLGDAAPQILAARLRTTETALVALLDTPPLPPASLGEPARWIGRQVPLLVGGSLVWMDLFWRREAAMGASREKYAMAARLTLEDTGKVEIRARLEDARLDVVMETPQRLPRVLAADLSDAFAGLLPRLRLQGSLTLRHSQQPRET
jgi:hypothetical protein